MMVKPHAEKAVEGQAVGFTLSSEPPAVIEIPAGPGIGKVRRRRRGSHTEIMVKPDAQRAVEVVATTPVDPTPTQPQVAYADWARFYHHPALHKGDWFDYEAVSTDHHREREYQAVLRSFQAQKVLDHLEQNMWDHGSFNGLRVHAIAESTRFPPEGRPNRPEVTTTAAFPGMSTVACEQFSSNDAHLRIATPSGWPSATEADNFNRIVASNDILEVRAVLDAGADVNAKDSRGFTPLHQAVYMGDQWLPIVNLLLKRGAIKDLHDSQGRNALTLAKYLVHEKVTALLEHGQRTLFAVSSPSFVVNTV